MVYPLRHRAALRLPERVVGRRRQGTESQRLLVLLLGLALCFWLSWRGAKRLETVANGLEALAQGQTVRLPTDGFAGELAEKLNQTGAQLQAKNEMLSRI